MQRAAEYFVEDTFQRNMSVRLTKLKRELNQRVLQQSFSRNYETQSPSRFSPKLQPQSLAQRHSEVAPKLPDMSVSFMDSSRRVLVDDINMSRINTENIPASSRRQNEDSIPKVSTPVDELDDIVIENMHIPLKNEERVAMRAEINTPAMKQLYSLLKNLSHEERYLKAARHLKDAMYLRPLRHDIDDNKKLKFCYYIQTSPIWQSFLFMVSWAFLVMTFWEPAYSGQDDYLDRHTLTARIVLGIEIIIILIFWFEVLIEVYHRKFDTNRSWKDKYLYNMKMVSKISLVFLFTLDCIAFYSTLPHVIFRFSRPFRPACLALYQKQLRRTVTGIIQSTKHMFDIMAFFFVIILVYGLIGVRLIGDLDGPEDYDKYLNNFSDFGITLNNMYILLTRDNYPSIMVPAYENSVWYLLYFIPFLIIDILLLFPIPIAIMFEAFRTHRGKLVIRDRIKEREALFASFICLDEDFSLRLERHEFKALFEVTYRHRLLPNKIDELFDLLDEEKRESVVLFTCSLIQVIIIMYTFSTDESLLETLDEIDNYLVYIYCGEIVIKIMGMGIMPYFLDTWNAVDFVLTIISVGTNVALSFTRVAKTTRLVRSLRAQRAFKLCKVIRSIKLFRFCFKWIRSVARIELLFRNIAICFPIVLKLTVILFMVSYFYSIVGMEIYNSTQLVKATSEYGEQYYADFDNLGGALLICMQVINQNGWGSLQYDFAVRFDSLAKSALFFGTYNAISNMIIISLLTGLIWEVFAFTSKNLEEQMKIDQVLEELSVYDRILSTKSPLSKTMGDDKTTKEFQLNPQTASRDRRRSLTDLKIEPHKFVIKSGVANNLHKTIVPNHNKTSLNEVSFEQKSEGKISVIMEEEDSRPTYTEAHIDSDIPLFHPRDNKRALDSVPQETESGVTTEEKPELFKILLNGSQHNHLSRNESYFGQLNGKSDLDHTRAEGVKPLFMGGDSDVVRFTSQGDEIPDEMKKQSSFQKKLKKAGKGKQYTEGNLFKLVEQEKQKTLNELIDVDYNEDSFFSDKYPVGIKKSEYYKMERKFYMKKIVVCSPYTQERNQMDHLLQNSSSAPADEKFGSEVVYLRIDEIEDEEEPEEKEEEVDVAEIGEFLKMVGAGQVSKKKFRELKAKVHDKILLKKRKMGFYAPTVDRIIRKALMQGADISSIKKYEEGYLSNLYGNWFHSVKSKSPDLLMTNFETENRCLIRLMRLMKQPDIVARDFVDIIHMIESSVNNNLCEKGSIAKFLFKDSQGRWFFTYKSEGSLKIHYVKHGPWGHFDEVFPEIDKLYESKDIMFPGNTSVYKEIVNNFHISLRRMAKVVSRNKFRDFSPKDTIWNMYTLPFETENTKALRSRVLKSIHRFSTADIKKVEGLLVTQAVFVSVNYLARAAKIRGHDQTMSTPPKQRIHMALPYSMGTDEIETKLVMKADSSSTMRRSNSSESLKHYKPVGPTHRRSRIKTRYFVGQDNFDFVDEERNPDVLNRQNSDNLSIPLQEYLDFLRDMRDILNQHREYFLTKMNVFYIGHAEQKF